ARLALPLRLARHSAARHASGDRGGVQDAVRSLRPCFQSASGAARSLPAALGARALAQSGLRRALPPGDARELRQEDRRSAVAARGPSAEGVARGSPRRRGSAGKTPSLEGSGVPLGCYNVATQKLIIVGILEVARVPVLPVCVPHGNQKEARMKVLSALV